MVLFNGKAEQRGGTPRCPVLLLSIFLSSANKKRAKKKGRQQQRRSRAPGAEIELGLDRRAGGDGRKADAGVVPVEGDVVALKEDITDDERKSIHCHNAPAHVTIE